MGIFVLLSLWYTCTVFHPFLFFSGCDNHVSSLNERKVVIMSGTHTRGHPQTCVGDMILLESRVRWRRETGLSSSIKYFTDRSKAVLLLLIVCVLCLVFLMFSRLFIAALMSPAGKGLTSWPLLVTFIVFLLLLHMVSWSDVVLDCIDF